ncbi:type II toxin-antitoxin system death-on-curing family toxin [Ferrovibrio sp.]|uniref:type II toxin-antitoxin system death-on-curing family toxin n=1 Tax=Ferrovibrio sp. TaxID=1917215 RepID=UPI003D2C65E7
MTHALLTAAQVKALHEYLTKIFEHENDPISPPGIKSNDLLESACSRPFISIGGVYKYDTFEKQLAALFQSLSKNHPFHNGNKRAALVSLLTALYKEGRIIKMNVTDDDLYKFVLDVTADSFPSENHKLSPDEVVGQIARWIRSNSIARMHSTSDMDTSDFLRKCEEAGALVVERKRSNAYFVLNGQQSIRISRSTRRIGGKAVMKFLAVLKLSESSTGFSRTEFETGVTEAREQIYRFIVALRRLART